MIWVVLMTMSFAFIGSFSYFFCNKNGNVKKLIILLQIEAKIS